ncbi:putative nitroreductase family protein [Blattamonas nauphoetae]|uniref:Nitroreductase family protein n=1 Tax=Blattamonas nauphoetae TaxID=2049346 RepID=A0ABQ9XG62_9EUKA|nr:putative nitroreductase family protein [Blattamonas nauphoetae]
MSDCIASIKARRACRKFLPTPVEKEKLTQILEAAQIAPSAMNQQPWHFYVVSNQDIIAQISDPAQEIIGKERPAFIERAQKNGVKSGVFYDAPTVIFISCKKEGTRFRQLDIGIATENIMLAATSLGLGSIAIGCFVDVVKAQTEAALKLSADEEVLIAIPIGYADNSIPLPPQNRRADNITFIE